MRKILFFLEDVGASSGELKNEFQPPFVLTQLGNLVQGAACPTQQYLLTVYPVLTRAFLGLESSGQSVLEGGEGFWVVDKIAPF